MWILGLKGLRASSREPGWPGWPAYLNQFHLGVHNMNWVEISHIQPGFRYEIRTKILGTNSGAESRETKQALATLISVKLQLNGMLMMWKIQQAKQDGVILFQRIHPTFIPVTGLKCSYGKIFQPALRDTGWKTRDLVNRASPPSQMNALWQFIRGKNDAS